MKLINDIKFNLTDEMIDIILKDRTTNKKLIWATKNYETKGFYENSHITEVLFSTKYKKIIIPRNEKSKAQQQKRSKDMAEVFTPSWICNKQNNLIDDAWFNEKDVFNKEENEKWIPSKKIEFKDKTFIDYINDVRLEITCGEAPYLVSRYDTVSGDMIEIKDRIGLLDRKLRVVNENTSNEEEWLKYAILSYKSIYGFDYQGDNVILSRENLLYTFIEYFNDRFNKLPTNESILEILNIISWNIWQMDGIKLVIPLSCKEEQTQQMSLFGDDEMVMCKGCSTGNHKEHNGVRPFIMDWEKNKRIKYTKLVWG
ncbi:MAG: restriction endonuclease subunit M [bacterium]